MSRIEEALRRASQEQAAGYSEPERAGALAIPPLPDAPPDADASDESLPLYSSEPAPEPADLEIAVPTPMPAPMSSQESLAPPRVSSLANQKLVVNSSVQPVAVEQYRTLAVTLHQMQVERGTRIVMIASAMAGEGKTLTAANLALTLSESFKRQVLLIDADMRRPSLHEIFRVSNVAGLGLGLKAEGDEKLTLIQVSSHLTILPAGRPDPNPISGLTSDRMRRILAEASAKFDWVVVDTPPIGLLPDANILAEMADTVVFVIGAGQTPFKPIQRAVDAIGRNRIAGVVLNRVTGRARSYDYYSHYHYMAQSEPQPVLNGS